MLDPALTFNTFVVGSGNQFAHAVACNVAANGGKDYPLVFLFGVSGVGKTHILHAIGNEYLAHKPNARVCLITVSAFQTEFIRAAVPEQVLAFRHGYQSETDVLLLDVIEGIHNDVRIHAVLRDIIEMRVKARKLTVVVGSQYPKDLKRLYDPLRETLASGFAADISPLTVEERVPIVDHFASEHHMGVDPQAALAIARKAGGSIQNLKNLLDRLYPHVREGAVLTKQVVHVVLGVPEHRMTSGISVDAVKRTVARLFNVDVEELSGPSRKNGIARARQVAVWFVHRYVGGSSPEIGRRFGGRDHTTILHSINKIDTELRNDPVLIEQVLAIKRELGLD